MSAKHIRKRPIQDPGDPLAPTGQVVTVPISGPNSDTTLVYIGGELELQGALSDQGRLVNIPLDMKGLLLRAPLVYGSSYQLASYTPGVTESRVQHSTAVWLSDFGPFKPNDFQFAVDAITYVGFNPAPNGVDDTSGLSFQADGHLYFIFQMAWKLSDNLFENCQKSITIPGTNPPSVECLLYDVPFSLQVSSYITLPSSATAPPPGKPHPRPGG